jgi:hypothetical protein
MITKTSKLSGFHTDDGITLEVKIQRLGLPRSFTMGSRQPGER